MVKWTEKEIVELPKGVSVAADGLLLKFTGPKGTVERSWINNYVRMEVDGNKVKFLTSKNNKKTYGILGTWTSGVRKAVTGVTEGYTYEMKIDYTHFPMRVSVRGNLVVIENFLGERSPRNANIRGDCKVTVKGDKVVIEGVDKNHVGETASNIERATKIKGFDLRVFQDGVYLVGGA